MQMEPARRAAGAAVRRELSVQRRRRVCVALGVSLLLHVGTVLIWVTPRGDDTVTAAQHKVRIFTKRTRSPRPLMRQRPSRVVSRPLARLPGVRGTPTVASAPAGLRTARRGLQGVPIPIQEGMPPPPDIPMEPLSTWPAPQVGPRARPGALAGSRVGTDEVDLSLEMLSPEALDTGRHWATVVLDPADRQAIRGYVHLARANSAAIERSESISWGDYWAGGRRGQGLSRRETETQTLAGLAQAMNEETGVRAEVVTSMSLDDHALLSAPFLLLTVADRFECTATETRNLGRYLTGGGFLYAEVVSIPRPQGNTFVVDIPSLRQLIRAALRSQSLSEGRDWCFVRLQTGHPLFHCYYDIDSLPLGYWDIGASQEHSYNDKIPEFTWSPPYLEGIQVHGALVGIYSQKDYADYWAGAAEAGSYERSGRYLARAMDGGESVPVYRLGVNILVYALTREGSVAQKIVAAE